VSAASRPALPIVPPREGALKARRDWLFRRLATCTAAFAAAIGVLVVAAAAVALALG
jgi:hypothetical protein